jgi:hypothetical protein
VKDLLLGISAAAAVVFCALIPARALPVPALLRVGAQSLAPASCATRNTLWIHHYAAALYVPPRASPVDALQDPRQPKALQVEILDKAFLPREMHRITLAYAPGPGVSLEVNDRLVAAAPSRVIARNPCGR